MNDSGTNEKPYRAGLLELLNTSEGTQFVIPVYQRNYTWKAMKEVRQFVDDLYDVALGHYANHFLGTIIYHSKPLGNNCNERSIIDGQQRLTTAFLFLYAVRDILIAQGNKDDADDLEKKVPY